MQWTGDARPCVVCDAPSAHHSQVQLGSDLLSGHGILVDCPYCGRFAVPRRPELTWLTGLDDVSRGTLRGVLAVARDRDDGQLVTLTFDSLTKLLGEAWRPKNGDELISAFLARVAREAPAFGSRTPAATPGAWAGRLSLHPTESLTKLARWVEQKRWIDVIGPMSSTDPSIAFELTLDGWKEFHARQPRGRSSTDAFIASWADPSIAGSPVEALCAAVRSAGLTPVVGCTLAGENRVTEDIELSIRRSRLVIADFTGGRNGVYWEAGFARGLGLPVIYTCHESQSGRFVGDGGDVVEGRWRDKLHFDTTQFPHIFWSTPDELAERVLKRIRARAWDESRGSAIAPPSA